MWLIIGPLGLWHVDLVRNYRQGELQDYWGGSILIEQTRLDPVEYRVFQVMSTISQKGLMRLIMDPRTKKVDYPARCECFVANSLGSETWVNVG